MTTKPDHSAAQPPIVSREVWQQALDAVAAREKAGTVERDALAAARRRLPMTKIDKDYTFTGSAGPLRLPDLFEGRRQLILYHFMYAPGVDGYPQAGCPGCSLFIDQISHLAHLHARDTSFCLVSLGPLEHLLAYRQRMGWQIPWYSSAGSPFNRDFGMTTDKGETHGLSVFFRQGDTVYRTYFTSERGCEILGSLWTLLDLTPLGRQEEGEQSPDGWPQSPQFTWWRRHDEYGRDAKVEVVTPTPLK